MIRKKLQGQVRRGLVLATACSLVLAGSAQPAHAQFGVGEVVLLARQLYQLQQQVRTSARQLALAKKQVEGLRTLRLGSIRSMARSFLSTPVPPLGQGGGPLDRLFTNHVPQSLRGSMGIATPNELAQNLGAKAHAAITRGVARNRTVDQQTTATVEQVATNCQSDNVTLCQAQAAAAEVSINNETRLSTREIAEATHANNTYTLGKDRRRDSLALANLAHYRRDMDRVQWYWQELSRHAQPRQRENTKVRFVPMEEMLSGRGSGAPRREAKVDVRNMPASLLDDPTAVVPSVAVTQGSMARPRPQAPGTRPRLLQPSVGGFTGGVTQPAGETGERPESIRPRGEAGARRGRPETMVEPNAQR